MVELEIEDVSFVIGFVIGGISGAIVCGGPIVAGMALGAGGILGLLSARLLRKGIHELKKMYNDIQKLRNLK